MATTTSRSCCGRSRTSSSSTSKATRRGRFDERRRKASPLVDVASMVRSLGYATAVGLMAFTRQHPNPVAASWAALWERWMAATFLRHYLATLGASPLVPAAREDIAALLDLLHRRSRRGRAARTSCRTGLNGRTSRSPPSRSTSGEAYSEPEWSHEGMTWKPIGRTGCRRDDTPARPGSPHARVRGSTGTAARASGCGPRRRRSVDLVIAPATASAPSRWSATSDGYWELRAPLMCGAGDRYRYRLDGDRTLPDPASRFQPEGVHGPSQVIDPRAFAWTDLGWTGTSLEHLIIYELHVGTFSPEGTFAGAAARARRSGAARRDGDRAHAGRRVPGRAQLGLRRRRSVRAVAGVRHAGRPAQRSSTRRTRWGSP